MRNRKHAPTRLILVALHPGPEVLGIVALDDREWSHLLRNIGAVTVDDVAVQVVAAGRRGPFIADDCGELAGVVERVGRIRGLLPDGLRKRLGEQDLGCVAL